MSGTPHQRLDLWLWYARVARHRSDCVALIERGRVRINRQPTSKPHAKVHIGDVLTLPGQPEPNVRVWKVLALGERRGPAAEAMMLYEDIVENDATSER